MEEKEITQEDALLQTMQDIQATFNNTNSEEMLKHIQLDLIKQQFIIAELNSGEQLVNMDKVYLVAMLDVIGKYIFAQDWNMNQDYDTIKE